MKFIKLVTASKDWEVEKINENDWVIKSPYGTYKNSNGKDYHFKTKEDALEELDYLRAEHKFDKIIKANNEDLKYEAKQYIDKAENSIYEAIEALNQVIRIFDQLNIHSLDITPYMINYLDNMIDGENTNVEDLKMRLQGDEE